MPRSNRFDDPIALPGREPLRTLRNAGEFIAGAVATAPLADRNRERLDGRRGRAPGQNGADRDDDGSLNFGKPDLK
jgi:hypothetical protein